VYKKKRRKRKRRKRKRRKRKRYISRQEPAASCVC
jgi:hypothetical protein